MEQVITCANQGGNAEVNTSILEKSGIDVVLAVIEKETYLNQSLLSMMRGIFN